MSTRVDLLGLSRSELADQLRSWGLSAFHAKRLWRYLYLDGVTEPSAMHELPAGVTLRLARDAFATQLPVARQACADEGRTTKFLLALSGGERIETVLMRCRGRVTACVSSQAGCALGCVFCATGQQGLSRNLTAGEIVAQALHVARALRADPQGNTLPRLRNVVFMGMGEPLANYEAVVRAIDILGDPGGLALAGKHITLSTVGVVPGIVRLADERRRVSLAVSLHAATQEERAALVPVARAWPLEELMGACRYYASKVGRRIFFEWTLIAGGNDHPSQAAALAKLLRGLPAQVNLIPLNPTAGYARSASDELAARAFRAILVEQGLPVTVRFRRGIEIAAGCGQLAAASSAS